MEDIEIVRMGSQVTFARAGQGEEVCVFLFALRHIRTIPKGTNAPPILTKAALLFLFVVFCLCKRSVCRRGRV